MPHKRHSKWSRRRHYRESYKRRRGSKTIAGAIIGMALVLGIALYSGILQVNPDVLEQPVGEISGDTSRDDTDTDTVVTMDNSGDIYVQTGADRQQPETSANKDLAPGSDSGANAGDPGSADIPVKADLQEPEAPLHDRQEPADMEIADLTEMPERRHDETAYLEELYDYALLLVNEDRIKHGLRPVELSSTASGQAHTDEMLEHGFFSHWYIDGTKPYVSYTKHGGRGLVAENACVQYGRVDPKDAVRGCQYSMTYDDAYSNWGHRDNILDPHRTHVNFGISYGGGVLYFAQHFENNLIDVRRLEVDDGILKLEGHMMPRYEIYGISIFHDPGPVELTGRIIETEPPYTNHSYDYGIFAGMLVEESPWSYIECSPGVIETLDGECVPYSTYQSGQRGDVNVKVVADVSGWLERDGLHTMYIFLNTPDGEIVEATSLTLEYL